MIFLFKGYTMKLTVKDKDFLAQLRALLDSKDLSIELKEDGLKRLILSLRAKIQAKIHFILCNWRIGISDCFLGFYIQPLEDHSAAEK